jgi:hypothetical protein
MPGNLLAHRLIDKLILQTGCQGLYGEVMNVPQSSLSETVAGEVRANLARKRRSGRSVALELGWTQPYMSRRLNGDVPFDVNDLAAIAEVLDVPVGVFFQKPDAVRTAPTKTPAATLALAA